jgi:hypothetical protein
MAFFSLQEGLNEIEFESCTPVYFTIFCHGINKHRVIK